jgi:hypothetical protein|tara:strand:+ start:5951 stop:6124 length:174 start_codon:yes stop_codon:yes gene_type:complete
MKILSLLRAIFQPTTPEAEPITLEQIREVRKELENRDALNAQAKKQACAIMQGHASQ